MSGIRKHLGLVTGAIIILILIGIGFVPRPVLVDIVAARRDTLQVTLSEEGRTRVMDDYVLSAPVDGYARRINLEVGDSVEKNQEIITLEPLPSNTLDPRSRAEAEARLASATAALHAAEQEMLAAQADARFAEAEASRLQKLLDSGVVSSSQYQQAEALARSSLARLESAGFTVEIARFEKAAAEASLKYSAAQNTEAALETVSVRAPVDGRILKIHHRSEGVILRGVPLLDIGDPHSLEIVAEVLSRDAVSISPGTRVLLTRWGGDDTINGRVRTVEPVGFTKISALGVEEQRVNVIIDITSPHELWERLGDGYRVETAFILWEQEDVLQVPSSALFRQGQEWNVYVINDNRAELRKVEPGQRSGMYTQIISGLKEGEEVINHPGDNLEPGKRIRPY